MIRMRNAIAFLPRSNIDVTAWDTCVQTSSQRLVYGYSWYLDAVLPAPTWQWIGLVQLNQAGQYQAVMPVPLRRKGIATIYQKWVVHQPFFCQFLSVYSQDESINVQPFFDALINHFRYGSVYAVRASFEWPYQTSFWSVQTTHVLDLSVGYQALYRHYTRDRKVNLRRAMAADWTILDSVDIEPLLTLFQANQAIHIAGGVSAEAYVIFRKLVDNLNKRGLVVLRYAVRHNQIEAGALFVCEGNRTIYLFNAASTTGRNGNARTLLIDRFLQERAGQPIWVDFESPTKQSIRRFYQSFGAVEEPFYTLRWNQLNCVEKALLRMKRRLGNY